MASDHSAPPTSGSEAHSETENGTREWRNFGPALGLALGMLGMASGWLPNTRPVVIGAIHFLVLSPVLGSLMPLWLRREPPVRAWWVYHGCVTLLAAPLAAYGLGVGAWTLSASALGGTLVLLWWLLILAFQSRS